MRLFSRSATYLAALANLRQRYFQCTPGCGASRAIAIEAEMYFVTDPEQAIEMLISGCRSQRCCREIDAVTRQPDDVHIALYNHQALDVP